MKKNTSMDVPADIVEILEGGYAPFFHVKGKYYRVVEVSKWEAMNEELKQQTRHAVIEEVRREVRRMGDTSDYPEWGGGVGVNVGLIPKEKVLDFLNQLEGEEGEKNEN